MAEKLIKGMTTREYAKQWKIANPDYSRKRYGKLRETDSIRTLVNTLYNNAAHRAARKNLAFTLHKDWIRAKLVTGVCELTGVNFDSAVGSPFVPSIDRIVNTLGYTPENCRMIIWFANQAKSTLNDEQFLLLLEKTAQGMRKQNTAQTSNL